MKKQNPRLNQLITLLNDGQFHSGSELGDQLIISRNAVNKYIKTLLEQGIEIETQQGVGYRLKTKLPMLDKKLIKQHVQFMGHYKLGEIEVLHKVNSTNDYIKSEILPHNNKIDFCFAEEQTHGRGRFGRNWYSPFASNIYFSFLWQTQKDISELSGLSLVVSLSVLQGIKSAGINENILIKWPNDLVYQHKKLAGTLLEIESESHGFTRIIAGIGVNVNMLNAEKNMIDQSWVSLALMHGKILDRNLIAGKIIQKLLENINLFNDKRFLYFKNELKKYDALKNQEIAVILGKKKINGTSMGVNDNGHLILQLADKSEMICSFGETSIPNKSSTTKK